MDRASGDPPKITLTEFFVLCQRDNFAKTLLYICIWMFQDTIPGEISPGTEENKEKM